MTLPSNTAGTRESRFSHPPNDRSVRIVAALGDGDEELVAGLRADGFAVARTTPESLAMVAQETGAEAVLVDADRAGALAAVRALRRSDGVVATVPVILVGAVGGALRTGVDAVEAGGDVFVPRPFVAGEVARRMRALLDLPGETSASVRPSMMPLTPVATLPGSAARTLPPADTGTTGAFELSAALTDVLRSAVLRAGGDESDLALPAPDDEGADDLVPPELLEPLDAPLDALGDELFGTASAASSHTPVTPTSATSRRSGSMRSVAMPTRTSTATPTLTPLAVAGEMRLSGVLGAHGVGLLLGAASRSRASGLLVLRSGASEFGLAVSAGHVLAVRSSRAQDEVGPLLARLGYVPREAARFAASPLEAGVRGAALLAARGYLAADTLAQALAWAGRELVFDLLALPAVEWEMRALESAVEMPLQPRALDALLVLGTRARFEPAGALEAMGGGEVTAKLRSESSPLATLPLTRSERQAVEAMRGGPLRAIVEAYGPEVLPAVLALAWLGWVRLEGGGQQSLVPAAPVGVLAIERTRVRALLEASRAQDFLALLGVTEWTTRTGAREAIESRRQELSGLRARHPDVADLVRVAEGLDEAAGLLAADGGEGWDRYVTALRMALVKV